MGTILSCEKTPFMKSLSDQSIENFIEDQIIKNEIKEEEKEKYQLMIKNLILDLQTKLDNIKIELFNHKLIINLVPIQGL